MLLLNTKQEILYGKYKGTITFHYEWLWKVKGKVTQFLRFVSGQTANLGHMLLLKTYNMKSHIGSPMAPSDLILRDLECQSQLLRLWRRVYDQ